MDIEQIESQDMPPLHVSQMTQDDLNTLTNIFYGHDDEVGKFPTFDLLWSFFLANEPDAKTAYGFFVEVEELGYYLERE